MSYTKTERDNYNNDRKIKCNDLGITKNQYNWFRRMADKLHTVYEDNCNGLYQTEEEADEAEREIIYKINVYKQECEELLYAYFQTDPRGASLYLSKERLDQTNYTRGHCIY